MLLIQALLEVLYRFVFASTLSNAKQRQFKAAKNSQKKANSHFVLLEVNTVEPLWVDAGKWSEISKDIY